MLMTRDVINLLTLDFHYRPFNPRRVYSIEINHRAKRRMKPATPADISALNGGSGVESDMAVPHPPRNDATSEARE